MRRLLVERSFHCVAVPDVFFGNSSNSPSVPLSRDTGESRLSPILDNCYDGVIAPPKYHKSAPNSGVDNVLLVEKYTGLCTHCQCICFVLQDG